jgi:hypothetical protein
MKTVIDNNHDGHGHEHKSLVTERDIDPAFGLFADEGQEGAVRDATDQLLERYPYGDVHESHIPYAIDAEIEADAEADSAEEISEELAAVPDADAVAKNSPVDPASPSDEFHGTDLLNGVGNHPEEETEETEETEKTENIDLV